MFEAHAIRTEDLDKVAVTLANEIVPTGEEYTLRRVGAPAVEEYFEYPIGLHVERIPSKMSRLYEVSYMEPQEIKIEGVSRGV